VRTRVGYSGGTLREPTYHHLGDHSETIEIDYDPSVLSYDDLLAVFFSSHSPSMPSFSTQYRSAVFCRTDEERAIAKAALARAETVRGKLFTAIEPFDTFWRAEDYHQKYRLRSHRELMAEFRATYSLDRDFVDSTAAARVNGWLEGYAESEQIDRELPLTGLSQHAQDEVRNHALPRGRALQR
jgi:peptide-methionine (S)-S-oxide reductase